MAKQEDWDAVKRMFRLILDVSRDLSPNLQVIVTEHADLNEEWFQDCVVERWRDGEILIPSAWVAKEADSAVAE